MARRTKKSGPSGGVSADSRGARELRVRVKSRLGASSRKWLERQLNDPYVVAAQRDGLRSRAAYKLIEINDKHPFVKSGHVVVDLGAAPGGWTQVLVGKVKSIEAKGQVVAIDILAMDPMPGADIVHLDFMEPSAPDRLKALLRDGGADAVVSDMAAPTTGHARTDHLQIMGLAEAAAEFAIEVLKPGGAFLCKVFQGGAERDLLNLLKMNFRTVRHVKPPASRKDSSELYVLATGFRGAEETTDAEDDE